MSDDFMCPRRAEGPAFTAGPDKWHERDGHLHCSFCGCLKPSQLFEAIEAGAELGPTDKNYKVYVDLEDPRAGQLKITGTSNSKEAPGPAWTEATEADIAQYFEGRTPLKDFTIRWVLRTPRGKIHDKFYFQHLSEEDRQRFIDLLNAKKLTIGYPGFFYVTPYFIRMTTLQ